MKNQESLSPADENKTDSPLPLVTVICLCYNQERFVAQALQSVIDQTYPNIQLIAVDDGSTDNSSDQIEAFRKMHPQLTFLNLGNNRGMCVAFNQGLQYAEGLFIIDLAADDVLLPHRIERQVEVFNQLDQSYGVIFTDAALMNEAGEITGTFYGQRNFSSIPSGNVYQAVLQKHFICSPTMMSRRQVYDDLEGYDETLCYEDFDFWVRSSRRYKYYFLNEVLTRKRQVAGSDSTQWYRRGQNPHLQSTMKVLQKAFVLNQNEAENQALSQSVRYHLRQAAYTENFPLALQFTHLLRKLSRYTLADYFFLGVSRYHIPLFWLYKQYIRRRFGKNT